jgi:peptidoglycan/xylan/chitin deacetylase (PgdA/CDA1 family)
MTRARMIASGAIAAASIAGGAAATTANSQPGAPSAVAASLPRPIDLTRVLLGPPNALASPLSIAAVRFGQLNNQLLLTIRTRHRWSTPRLAAAPGRSLCLLVLRKHAPGPGIQVCVSPHDRGTLTAADIDAGGRAGRARTLTDATVARPTPTTVTARFRPADIRLAHGIVRWQVRSTWSGGACTAPASAPAASASPCTDTVPAPPGVAHSRVVAVKPIGCDSGNALFVSNGSRSLREVALAFDDGPWPDTPGFLNVLEQMHANASFFQIGEQIPEYGGPVDNRMLADGDDIGDHTETHPDISAGGSFAYGEILGARSAIQAETGYTPCIFRIPYGAGSYSDYTIARGLGLATIGWDVDPTDWARPGTGAIISRVMSMVQPGSILEMHDGGGDRSETLAALPVIINDLRARGLKPVSVTQLLGYPIIYGRA